MDRNQVWTGTKYGQEPSMDRNQVWTGTKWEQKAHADWRDPYFSQSEVDPVVLVSWYAAVKFCNWLSRKEGLTVAYSGSGKDIQCDYSSNGYRLATEAEWEYAAEGGHKSRGYEYPGSKYAYAGSNLEDEVGWHYFNSGKKTHPVEQKKPNELGFYDMSGNVWEWCWDWYGKYSLSEQADPRGPSTGSERVCRGGGWDSYEWRMRVESRFHINPLFGTNTTGFRVVRTAE